MCRIDARTPRRKRNLGCAPVHRAFSLRGMRTFRPLLVALMALSPALLRAQAFDQAEYDGVVRAYVSERGVDYARLQADRGGLDRYVARLGAVSTMQFDAWNRSEK